MVTFQLPSKVLIDKDDENMDPDLKKSNYVGRIMGNSEEFMPLDADLISNAKYWLDAHFCATFHLPDSDPRKIKKNSVKNCVSGFLRSWARFPTLERVAKDVIKVMLAWQIVAAARGKKVKQLDRRSGIRKYKKLRIFDGSGMDDGARSALNEQIEKYVAMGEIDRAAADTSSDSEESESSDASDSDSSGENSASDVES